MILSDMHRRIQCLAALCVVFLVTACKDRSSLSTTAASDALPDVKGVAEFCMEYDSLSPEDRQATRAILKEMEKIINRALKPKKPFAFSPGDKETCDIAKKATVLVDFFHISCDGDKIADPYKALFHVSEAWIRVTGPCRDVSALGFMPRLVHLRFFPEEEYDYPFDQIAKLKQLETASFYKCKNPDISALGELTGLTELSMSGCQVTDISSLQNMARLEALDLTNNAISEVWPLMGMGNLRRLSIKQNQVLTKIEPLAVLESLEYLDLSYNSVTDIAALSSLANLKVLLLSLNKLLTMKPLASLQNLKALDVSLNQFHKVDKLEGVLETLNAMPALETLQISEHPWTDAGKEPACPPHIKNCWFNETQKPDFLNHPEADPFRWQRD